MPNKKHRNFCTPWATLLFVLFLFSHSTYLIAQVSLSSKKHIALNWQLDATISGVEFYHTIEICNDKKVVFLKLNNKNNYKVEISWKEEFTTQQEQNIGGYLGKKNIILGLGETKETDCQNPSQKELLVLPEQVNPTYIAVVSTFDYKEIIVTKTK